MKIEAVFLKKRFLEYDSFDKNMQEVKSINFYEDGDVEVKLKEETYLIPENNISGILY